MKDVYRAIERHFQKYGDTIRFKDGGNPNASYDVIRGEATKYAYGRLKSWQDAEDAVQEAYLRLLERAKDEKENIGGLFKVILDHIIIDFFRKDTRDEDINVPNDVIAGTDGLTLVDLAEGDELDPAHLLEIEERVKEIMDATNKMSPKAKGIVRMSLLFGYTNQEVANLLRISTKKVSNTLEYFHKKYKEVYNGGV